MLGARRRTAFTCLVTLLLGCGNGASGAMVVWAASSLEGLLPSDAPGDYTLRFDSSSRLVRQVEAGAGVDVLIVARPQLLTSLEAEGRVLVRKTLGTNSLVLAAVDRQSCPDLTTTAGPAIGLAAETVPLGAAAEQAFRATGEWPSVEARAVRGSNARSVSRWLSEGELSSGVIYQTDLGSSYFCRSFDPSTHDSIEYVAVALRSLDGRVHPRAQLFVNQLELEAPLSSD